MFNSDIYQSKQFKRAIENVNNSNNAILSVIHAVAMNVHQPTQTEKRCK